MKQTARAVFLAIMLLMAHGTWVLASGPPAIQESSQNKELEPSSPVEDDPVSNPTSKVQDLSEFLKKHYVEIAVAVPALVITSWAVKTFGSWAYERATNIFEDASSQLVNSSSENSTHIDETEAQEAEEGLLEFCPRIPDERKPLGGRDEVQVNEWTMPLLIILYVTIHIITWASLISVGIELYNLMKYEPEQEEEDLEE